MGKTQILGSLVNTILTDSSNNVGIGGAANASFKLQVTGTTNLTGALSGTSATLSSSLGVNSTIRSTGQTDPASGVGMELFYRAADTSSYIQSYDRTNGAWKDVRIYGNALYFGSQGTNNLTIASTGAATFSSSVTVPSITNGGSFKMDYGSNASSRSWRIISDSYNFGDFSIQQSTTQAGSTYADRLLISASGNVGIGTSNPASAGGGYGGLDIRGSGGGSIVLGSTSSINTYLYAEFSGLYVQTTSTTPILFLPGGSERMRITSGGNVGMPTTYGFTTSNAANLFIDSGGGLLYRSTSSLKYKTDIEDLNIDTTNLLSKMRPVWYRSLGDVDRKDWSWYGFIAEELAEIEPRLVHFGYSKDSYEEVIRKDEKGNIKIETKLKDNAVKDEPDGVQYERITVLLVAEMQKMRTEIEELKALINK